VFWRDRFKCLSRLVLQETARQRFPIAALLVQALLPSIKACSASFSGM
jgi:hypothetical protein